MSRVFSMSFLCDWLHCDKFLDKECVKRSLVNKIFSVFRPTKIRVPCVCLWTKHPQHVQGVDSQSGGTRTCSHCGKSLQGEAPCGSAVQAAWARCPHVPPRMSPLYVPLYAPSPIWYLFKAEQQELSRATPAMFEKEKKNFLPESWYSNDMYTPPKQ